MIPTIIVTRTAILSNFRVNCKELHRNFNYLRTTFQLSRSYHSIEAGKQDRGLIDVNSSSILETYDHYISSGQKRYDPAQKKLVQYLSKLTNVINKYHSESETSLQTSWLDQNISNSLGSSTGEVKTLSTADYNQPMRRPRGLYIHGTVGM